MTQRYDYDTTTRTATVDGLRIHYHDAGEGPVVVLLHGAGPGVSGWGNFGENIQVFARHHRTLLIDQPGFGSSDQPDHFEGDYFTFSANIVKGLLDQLGIEAVNLVGNSLGGGVATRFALDHPDSTLRLALMGPGGFTAHQFISEPTLGHARLYAFYEDGETREALETFMRGMVFDPDVVTEEMLDDRYRRSQLPGSAAFFDTFRQSFQAEENLEKVELWRHVHRIEHDTAIIWGREDLVNPWDGALFGFSRMKNATLHVLSSCGHWAQTEKFDQFNEICLDLFARG